MKKSKQLQFAPTEPLIFTTNIQTKRQLFDIEEVLSTHPSIASWHVDTDDIDNVLRIELKEVLSEIELIEEAHKLGIACAVMEG
jgi:hypothetical protein